MKKDSEQFPGFADHERRETVHIWLTVAIALVLASFRLMVHFSDQLRSFWEHYTSFPVAEWLLHFAFFSVLALCWLVYHRWRQALVTHQELRAVVSSISPHVLLVLTPEGRISMVTDVVTTMFGYTPRDLVGRPSNLLLDDDLSLVSHFENGQVQQGTGFHVCETVGKRHNKSTFPLEIVMANLKGRRGLVVLLNDITERKEARKTLLDAKERLEAASVEKNKTLSELHKNYAKLQDLEQLRDKLTHMVVHDMKAPLSAAILQLDLLRESVGEKLSDPEKDRLLQSIDLTRHLTEMINSVLDVSRLESHEMPIHARLSDLLPVAHQATHIPASKAEDRQILVKSPTGKVIAFCDPELIRRVIINLVDNAVKFTLSDGKIIVALQQASDHAKIQVVDNGTGIPKEYHEKIFDRFGQVEARRFSTGLGLTFCKLAIEAHGGKIGVESEVGRGATFWITLPCFPLKMSFPEDHAPPEPE